MVGGGTFADPLNTELPGKALGSWYLSNAALLIAISGDFHSVLGSSSEDSLFLLMVIVV
jgi:hypothetical protein